MPLFSYQCKQCEQVVEKFQHNAETVPEMKCKSCGCEDFDRLVGTPHNRNILDAHTNLADKILPDVQRIQNELKSGKDSTFLDLYGEK